ncbi:hemolysin D [Desulfobotulus alkaliphilus]|uniref:Hemolysin D n=1 Tax=Desulfobotulus alkaliphilus TaxID=622671 RepID=A0A562RQB5_9BACT|nr:HlyD family type I secretion periplasmic adaptor subunit [Desulfobotulus alkaliphilus]TWI71252.1 hemolysin D [Desulfobotulus alkaliphilus]
MAFNEKDGHEFRPLLVEIEQRPLNPLGRLTFWILLAVIFLVVLWLTLGKIDVVVTARGKVIPAGEVKVVQPLNAGVVRSILVQPGDLVEEGQVLMEIDPSDIDPELESMRMEVQQAALALLRLENLLADQEFIAPAGYDASLVRIQQDLYFAFRDRLDGQIRVKEQEKQQITEKLQAQIKVARQAGIHHAQALERLSRLEKVQDLLSLDEMEQAQLSASESETLKRNAHHDLEALQAGLKRVEEEMTLLRDEEKTRLLTELAETRQRRTALDARIEQAEFRSRRQQITAPVKGYVAHLQLHTVGGVVTPAEKLAYIVPVDSPLLIKALVSGRDVGFIEAGMSSSIKIDTFEFQKYGLIDGHLIQISKNSVEDESLGLMFEILVQPEKTHLWVEGREVEISIGMGATAELKVGKRRIIEFFIYPLIRYLDEGVRVR